MEKIPSLLLVNLLNSEATLFCNCELGVTRSTLPLVLLKLYCDIEWNFYSAIIQSETHKLQVKILKIHHVWNFTWHLPVILCNFWLPKILLAIVLGIAAAVVMAFFLFLFHGINGWFLQANCSFCQKNKFFIAH